MTPKPKLMLAVPSNWFDQFLNDEMLAALQAAFGEVVRIDDADFAKPRWSGKFAELKPDAVLSCWGTPTVPPAALPGLKIVAHSTGGVRQLVSRQMIENGLLVTNWGELAAPSVAECALLLILCALRKVTAISFTMHHDKSWPAFGSVGDRGLFGRRVGLHGFGHIARFLVTLLKPFGCRISSYSAGVPKQVFLEQGVTPVDSLEELFASSEVLVEVEALTPATRHSITEELFRLLPPGAVFVNVGRGAVVDEAALIKIALEGKIQFGLDVYESEPPPPDSPLRGLPNVTMLPHIGGPTPDRLIECGGRAVENLLRFARGEKPIGAITPEIYDRST